MVASIGAQQEILVGKPTTIESDSPSAPYATVFEDDGDTGYFYALDLRDPESPIRDALHIYNVASVTDRKTPSTLQIVWSTDGLKAGLIINRHPHAVVDFQSQRAVCRTGFPEPLSAGGWSGHDWDDKAVGLLI
jgi:hypothetical protein